MKAYTVNNHLVGVGNDQILGTDQGGGSKEYYAGQYISIDENNVISVTGLAPATAIPDTSDMATKTWVGEQGYLTSVPEGYATDQELAEAVSAVSSAIPTLPETEEVEFEELDLSDYALASAIPAAQVNSDWNANSGVAEILNKPTEIQLIAGTNVQVEVTGASAIISAQGGGGGATYSAGQNISINNQNVIAVTGLAQADWNSSSGASQILNKPTEKNLVAGANVTITESGDDVVVQTTEIASGLQLVAGKGVTLTVSGTQVIAGLDETVLWTGTFSGSTGSSNYITLSESAANFDTIEITMGGGYKTKLRYDGAATNLQVFSPYVGTSHTATVVYALMYTVTNSGTRIYCNGITLFNSSGWSTASSMNVGEVQLTKVVGIGRK